jgi:acetyl esterase
MTRSLFANPRLDPELAAASVLLPEIDLRASTEARRLERTLSAEIGGLSDLGVATRDLVVPTPEGGVPIRWYESQSSRHTDETGQPRPTPVILYLHGGAFVLGGLHSEHGRCAEYCAETGAVVVSVDYRLSPENPYPAAVEDGMAVLRWLVAEAEDLGLDVKRIVLAGLSAGGCLAAVLAIAARDQGICRPRLQMLINPVTDSSLNSPSMSEFTSTPMLTTAHSHDMWELYRGAATPADADGMFAPAHAATHSDLAPAFISVAELDPLRDEGITYAMSLLRAGVGVDLHCYMGTYHAFDSFQKSRVARRSRTDQINALQRAFARSS